jgi:hypothetical protein
MFLRINSQSLFSLSIVEYFVSMLGHQHDVIGDLAIAMAKLRNSNAYHILAIGGWHRLWLRCQVQPRLKAMFIDLRNHKEQVRIHFIADLNVGVFVTLRAPNVRNILASWRSVVKLIKISVLFSFPIAFLAESFTLSPSATQGALLFAR